VVTLVSTGSGPGLAAPVLFLAAALAVASPQPARAQQPPPAPAVANVPLPDRTVQLKLLWGIMAAVDQANRSGNYSVLRDLGTANFQANNNPAALAAAFAPLRAQQMDLADTFLVAPTFDSPPAMTEPTLFRMTGRFPLRPTAIAFDVAFQWERGAWRLSGLAVRGQAG